jgi:hypothetical protein
MHASYAASMHQHRTSLLDYPNGGQTQPSRASQNQLSRNLQAAAETEHEIMAGIQRAAVRLPSNAHLTATPVVPHHVPQNHSVRTSTLPPQSINLKRPLPATIEEEDHHTPHHPHNAEAPVSKRMLSVEEPQAQAQHNAANNASRPPLSRGDSLPAVSIAVPFVTDRPPFKTDAKHPLRTASFDTSASFKNNGECSLLRYVLCWEAS